VRSPGVSGALSYKELCMVAKHEEKRLAEIKERQDNEKTFTGRDSKYRSDRQASRSDTGRSSNTDTGQAGNKDVRRCYICNKARHVAKFCKTSNKEEEASGNLSKSDGKSTFSTSQCEHPAKTHATKQVNTKPSADHSASGPGTAKKEQSKPSSSGVSVDPVSLLYSSDSESSVDL